MYMFNAALLALYAEISRPCFGSQVSVIVIDPRLLLRKIKRGSFLDSRSSGMNMSVTATVLKTFVVKVVCQSSRLDGMFCGKTAALLMRTSSRPCLDLISSKALLIDVSLVMSSSTAENISSVLADLEREETASSTFLRERPLTMMWYFSGDLASRLAVQ